MKLWFKRVIFVVADKIVRYSEQFRNENLYVKFNISKTVRIHNVSLEGNVRIGDYTYINEKSRIDSGQNSKIEIGSYCAIGRNVHITAKTHAFIQPTPDESNLAFPHEEKDVQIGNYVWIGDNTVILPGIKIEDYAIVGANTVVNRDVSRFEIVGGVPAKHIRFNTQHKKF